MKTTLITIAAALTAITLGLAGCGGMGAREVPLHYVGQPVLLPDGHSSEALLTGGTSADPQHFSQDTVTEGVHTYWSGGRLISQVHDMRPVTAPSAGYALAQMIVPPIIEGGATFGAGVVVAHGIEQAGAWQAEGTAASGKAVGQGIAKGDSAIGAGMAQSGAAIGQGYASAKPPVINVANGNTISTSVSNTVSASSSSRSSASATARAQQSQGQVQAQGFFLNGGNVP